MKTNTKIPIVLALLIIIFSLPSRAQNQGTAGANYCMPTFSNGCFNWRTINIMVNNLTWSQETATNCQTSSFLNDTIFASPGGSYNVEITNANWCGTGVWIDFGRDFGLDSSDNVFHSYQANETNIYQFGLSLPDTMAPGVYRFRVVTGWGTDCFSESNNGFGPCGSYQYGNFQDFSLKVQAPTAVSGLQKTQKELVVTQDETGFRIISELSATLENPPRLWNSHGQLMGLFQFNQTGWTFPSARLSKGIYLVEAGKKGGFQKVILR